MSGPPVHRSHARPSEVRRNPLASRQVSLIVLPVSAPMKMLLVVLACCLVGTSAAPGAENSTRFSQTLSTSERAEIGLDRFTSDEIAVLDALVRRDISGRLKSSAENTPAAFSQRLTADERCIAGLARLEPAAIARLDSLVARHANAVLAPELLAPPRLVSRSRTGISPREEKPANPIHGTFSLTFGVGSGGYSERSGSMLLRFDDPAGRYSISVGYTESHIKGGPQVYRDDPLPAAP